MNNDNRDNRRAIKILTALLLLHSNRNHHYLLFINYMQRKLEEESYIFELLVYQMLHNIEHIRPNNYYNDWIPLYLDSDFYDLYRMHKKTFFELLRTLNLSAKHNQGGGEAVPIEKQLLITLWWLGKGEVLISIADRFGVSLSTVYNCTMYVLEKILQLKDKYIVWPDENETHTIEAEFRARSGYPGVVGAIDVCNVTFKAPIEQHVSYIDRYLNRSIKLQAIATPNKIFTNIMVGFPGSAHDSRVLRNSQLYFEVEENNNYRKYFIDRNYHLVGDSAYPLCEWIMKPYQDNGRLTAVQRYHNTCLSVTRVVVEHTFGILKSRWKILKFINVNSIRKAIQIIAACCVLHNFCYVLSDFWDQYEPIRNDENDHEEDFERNEEGIMKRDTISRQLFHNYHY